MKPVSSGTIKVLGQDGFMKKCCLCGSNLVQWHHNLIFGGQQCDEPFAILPLCPFCHEKADRKDVKDRLDFIMLNRMTEDELDRYSKVSNLRARKEYLNNIIYGQTFN